MKKRNRMLAILLAFTMVLTFMPMLAFAEGEEADAEPQVTEATAEEVDAEAVETEAVETEAVETEAVEEVAQKEAAEAVSEEIKPIALEFVPASGVTLWGFEGSNYIDGNAFYADGNQFIVTYSDNKTKKTFTCVTIPEDRYYTGYFEGGIVKKKADGEYDEAYFFEDIPESGLKRGDNDVKFGMSDGEDEVWTKTFKVVGKPCAVSASYTPATVNATIYPEWDYIDLYQADSQFVVKYNDNSTKTFKPVEVKYPDGGIGHEFKCGDEELQWGYDSDSRLKEGNSKLTLYLYNLKPYSDDDKGEITCTVNVNASKVGVCTTHKLRKVKATKATCQEPGIKAHYQCTVCLKIFTDKNGKKETTYAKLATKKAKHVFKKKIVSDEYLKSPATCTKKATYYYACKTCGEKGKKTFTAGKALGHKFENSVTKATPTKNGSIGQKCTVCGKKGKGKVIPKASKIAVVKKYKKKGVPAAALAGGAFIEVKNAKGKKIAASEYDIVFNNNEEAGTGSATITFKGDNYEGSKVVSYKIVK